MPVTSAMMVGGVAGRRQLGEIMIVLRHVGRARVVIVAMALATAMLGGCTAVAEPSPSPPPTEAPVQHDDPEPGWCIEYGETLNRWHGASLEVDEARFDELIGVDFIGPADCYLELFSQITTKSVVAVYLGDDPAVAEFMASTLPPLGWDGAVPDPMKGGVFTHPSIGDLGYSFSADAKSSSIPIDGPAIVVTVLLAG